jgi:hypothetical protein
MMDWADRQAETIVDAFLAYRGTHDLLRLQRAIAAALCRAKEVGEAGKSPETMMLFRENG